MCLHVVSTHVRMLVALLKQYRRDQSDLAIAALAVVLLLSLVWVLMGWENPVKWMEQINKEQRHQHMMDHRPT